jgi:TonB family protein
MPEDILVVEYEPRYTERVKQALSGQPFTPLFAKDGEEALRSLESRQPRLIVLSTVTPKISADLIRQIRQRSALRTIPILVTVTGYNGKSPQADAVKIGASDILPKPYSESEFLGKVQSMLGLSSGGAAPAAGWPQAADPEVVAHSKKSVVPISMTADEKNPALTSNDLFGDLLDEDSKTTEVRKPQRRAPEDLDQMLADTLSGVRVPKRTETVQVPAVPAAPRSEPSLPRPQPVEARPQTPLPAPARPEPRSAAEAGPKPAPAPSDFDKLLEDTLSGIERSKRSKADPVATAKTQAMPMPKAEPPRPAPPPAPSRPAPLEKVAMSAPILAPQSRPSAKEEPEDTSGIRFGQYGLMEKIATGGMAEVWKARMRGVEGFQKIVAIKKILPHLSDNEEFVTMFVDEAKLAAQLSHNNIIHIYDLGKIANSYYIAMEYIDGHDLKTILKRGAERGQPVPVEIALFITSKIASALDYAHGKRDFNEQDLELVHRDVSPQNVLISHEGDIKLCDFGIAKAASKASHTQAGALKGKLQYMSPEQAWGKKVDRRSDIFALSAVLFEMLAGRKLFAGESEISILEQVREARVTPPSEINDEVTPEIDSIVLKALQKNPEDRYQTAGEMAKDLDSILYSFRPTPTSADLAIYMHRIYSAIPQIQQMDQSVDEPEDDAIAIKPVDLPPPVVAPQAAAAVSVAPPTSFTFGARAEESEKKFPLIPVAIAAVVAVVAIGGYLATRGKSSPAASGPVKTGTSTAAPVSTSSQPLAPTTTAPVSTATSPAAAPGNDQVKVDEEVKRRLEAERLKLEQQRAQQLAAGSNKTPPALTPPRNESVAATQQQTAPAPPPAPATVVESRPAPPPAVVATQAPAPVAEAPRPTVHEGDLVQQGTEGLVPPELVRQFKPPYPSMAHDRRVEGVVVVSALISETGQVLDVKIIRGVPLLNEAAIDSVRRSTFRPATKDGIKVRSYKTLSLPFKL